MQRRWRPWKKRSVLPSVPCPLTTACAVACCPRPRSELYLHLIPPTFSTNPPIIFPPIYAPSSSPHVTFCLLIRPPIAPTPT
ncbi:uncharacterized protein SCHCODRAFT_02630346 [Schizophyllum commune H4-8]|uniref:uncharacterized protein n=1 Tax=Schizophyllum commune (strain H4-8 / FGSC 9210) TaxID=578458 RepID=UPI00215E8C4A|nr:uncharacterized protein SCHCODRAFT_02630346 [Schizophyllum commune H4-8]KAI5889896.1 hypothetical protein SCHCODRAFT_02630346 [Schizophyllum commune H4-8]